MLLRPEVESLPPFKPVARVRQGPGSPVFDRVARLNSNEAPWEPFPDALEAMRRALSDLNRYPENTYSRFKEALAEHHGMPQDRIVVGNGSHELIRRLCLILVRPGDEVIVSWPVYTGHNVSSRIMGGVVREVPVREDGACDLEAMLDHINEKTRLVFICSPHNPTGGAVRAAALDDYFARVPEHVVTVLDQAYFEYVTDDDVADGRRYLEVGKHVAVLRTFSKIYGLAGLRAGFVLATPELYDGLNRVREPFPVNHLSVVAAIASLGRPDLVEERRLANAAERARLEQAFDEMGLTYTPSQANFILVTIPGGDSKEIAARLRDRGVLVRPGDDFNRLDAIRVTVGLPDENDQFLAAFRDVLAAIPA